MIVGRERRPHALLNVGAGSSSNDTSRSESGTYGQSVHGTGLTTMAPVNQSQQLEALDYLHGLTGPGGDVANARSNLRTYGDLGLGTAGGGASYLRNVLGGQYLNSNPFLDQTFQQGAGQLEAANRSAWGGSDVLPGSPGQQAALGNTQANFATGLYGGAYNNERGLQNQAAGMIPGSVSSLLQPGQVQLQAGMAPQQAYIQGLSALNPGQSTSLVSDINTSGFKDSTGTSSSSGDQAGASGKVIGQKNK